MGACALPTSTIPGGRDRSFSNSKEYMIESYDPAPGDEIVAFESVRR